MFSLRDGSSPKATRSPSRGIAVWSRPISAQALRRGSPRAGAQMAEPHLKVSGLVPGYGDVDVLRGLDLEVARGEIVAVLGSNGAGKTTLNTVLSGLLRARGG